MLILECLWDRIVRIVDKADADSVVLWDVEGLNLITLGEATDTPLLNAGILQILGYHLGTISRKSHVNLGRSCLFVCIAGETDEGFRMLSQILQQT